jgi:hypothetical protein
MAFRPGAVDLPEQSSKGDPNAITLPEVLPEYDSTLPDFEYATLIFLIFV